MLTPQNYDAAISSMVWRNCHVKSTHLLHEHDDLGSHHGVPVAADLEQLGELVARVANLASFDLEQGVGVEQIASSLDLCHAHLAHGLVGLHVLSLAHVVARRLGAQEGEGADDEGGDGGGAKHETPLEVLISDLVKGEIDSESDPVSCEQMSPISLLWPGTVLHDTKGSPHLPLHGEGTSKPWRRTLGGVHGRRG